MTDLQPIENVRDTRYSDGRFIQVRNFRVQLTDPQFVEYLRDRAGDALSPVPVEIRAREITGPILDGDKVEVRGFLVTGTVHTKEVYNHSAGSAPLTVKESIGAV